mgnify:CR=1 FL=1
MTSNDVIELGEQFRGAGKKIEKALEIMAERGTHEAIPRIEEQANKAARAIQAAMDLVVEVGASLAGPGALFAAVDDVAKAIGPGNSMKVTTGTGKTATLKGK